MSEVSGNRESERYAERKALKKAVQKEIEGLEDRIVTNRSFIEKWEREKRGLEQQVDFKTSRIASELLKIKAIKFQIKALKEGIKKLD